MVPPTALHAAAGISTYNVQLYTSKHVFAQPKWLLHKHNGAYDINSQCKKCCRYFSIEDIYVCLLSCFPYCKIFEEHIAPLVLDGGEDDHDADDHAEDDADHQHEAAVHQLQHTGIGIV